MQEPLVGVFSDYERARSAIEHLERAGIAPGAISVLAREPREARRLADATGTDSALEGATTNDRFADLVGWLTGIGAIVVPAVGPDIATGTLGATLPAAHAGSGHGSVTGALVGLGLSVDAAAAYEQDVADGRLIVVVRDDAHAAQARSILAGSESVS